MKKYDSKNVQNGTYATVTINGKYMAELSQFEAKDKYNTEKISQAGTMRTGTKITSVEGSWSGKFYKISSYFATYITNCIAKGKTPTFDIINTINDPDGLGIEKQKLCDCVPDEATLISWERGKLMEHDISGSYSDVKTINSIKDNG